MRAISAFFTLGLASLLIPLSHASPYNAPIPTIAPQPTACIGASFRTWEDRVTLRLRNNCGKPVDFQNAVITFQSRRALNTSFWGNFDPLSYPDNDLNITASRISDWRYLESLSLHFPGNSILPADASISIKYRTWRDAHIDGSTLVYLGETAPNTGSIELINASARPANVTQNYAVVHVTMNGQKISDVQLPWNGVQAIPNLAVGTYAIAADSVTSTDNRTYLGSANPSSVAVVAGQTVKSTITYTGTAPTPGKIAIRLQALPSQLNGYTGKPVATLTSGGSSVPANLDWNTTTTVSSLTSGSTYTFSTPVINFNGWNCAPTFNPASLVADSVNTPVTNLTYSCSQVAQAQVTVNVSGGPATLPSLKITFTPNNNTSPVAQTVNLSNGSGSSVVMLTGGVVYNVSADAVSGYNASFNPQPLTAANNATETVTLSQANGSPVSQNGQLHVCGTQLCNEHNQPIQLKGMSSHGIQWYGWQGSNTEKACLTTASLDTLATTWGASVMRISMYVQEGGYESDPAGFTAQVNTLIDEATKRGIYAIVDFHQLEPGDPNYNLARAKTFFTAIANAHKNNNNLLYEICNEPSGVTWTQIKNYANALIPVIRAIDPKTPIIVGTRAWSSLGISDGGNATEIINSPVAFPNILYTFHFYAASHKDEYYNELNRASNSLPIFVTEFGTQTYTGDGGNDFVMSQKYLDLLAAKKIGWTNWNYSDDSRSGAVWTTGTCSNGPWTDSRLKPAGAWIKARIK